MMVIVFLEHFVLLMKMGIQTYVKNQPEWADNFIRREDLRKYYDEKADFKERMLAKAENKKLKAEIKALKGE
jgi:hypothetical protein